MPSADSTYFFGLFSRNRGAATEDQPSPTVIQHTIDMLDSQQMSPDIGMRDSHGMGGQALQIQTSAAISTKQKVAMLAAGLVCASFFAFMYAVNTDFGAHGPRFL